MAPQQYANLHVHDHYSLLDGAGKTEDFCKSAADKEQEYLAITNHGNISGALKFEKEAKNAGIKHVHGVEFYIVEDRFARGVEKGAAAETERDPKMRNHVLVLAKDNVGLRNIINLQNISIREGFYYRPRIDWLTLEKFKKGLIVSSACMLGKIPQMLMREDYSDAYREALRMREIYGENFFLEMGTAQFDEQRTMNNRIKVLADKTKIPLIVTSDAHYPSKEWYETHEVLLCMQQKALLSDPVGSGKGYRWAFNRSDYFLHTEAEVLKVMTSFHGLKPREALEAIRNSYHIAQACCNVKAPRFEPDETIPPISMPEGYTSELKLIKDLCLKGWKTRNIERFTGEKKQEYIERLKMELTQMHRQGFIRYMLIIWDLINYSRSQGIRVGPGRGSAAGSLVCYLLGITSVDPIEHGLIFSRFISDQRRKPTWFMGDGFGEFSIKNWKTEDPEQVLIERKDGKFDG